MLLLSALIGEVLADDPMYLRSADRLSHSPFGYALPFSYEPDITDRAHNATFEIPSDVEEAGGAYRLPATILPEGLD
jgi:hypothetical protein